MKFLFYLLRWQLSTPILAVVTSLLMAKYGCTVAAVVANVVGACVFYKLGKYIFKSGKSEEA